MENASNALMLAAGVLIGVIILSVLVTAFRAGGEFASSYEDRMETTAIARFNEKFFRISAKKQITVHDITTLVNLVEDYNKKSGAKLIDVQVGKGNSVVDEKTKDQKLEDIKNSKYNYVYKYHEYDDTGRIKLIVFERQ